MIYRYARNRENYEHLASGHVVHSAPGFPAFPVRLASEIFQRARRHTRRDRVTVWDPLCGSGYLLTTLGLLHAERIDGLLGSDIDPDAVRLASRNLALLGEGGLELRAAELRRRADVLGKPSYGASADSALHLVARLTNRPFAPATRAVVSDVFDPERLVAALDGDRPDVVITDVPYGEATEWGGDRAGGGIEEMLLALDHVLDTGAVVAIVARGRRLPPLGGRVHLESFRLGTRTIGIFRARSVEGRSR